MSIRKRRLKQGWSQQQLADLSGLSIRTIQRIERDHHAGTESLKSLAAVFDVHFSELHKDNNTMNDDPKSQEEQDVMERVKELKGFYNHGLQFAITMAILFIFNIIITPDFIWAWFAAIGWGIGLMSHGLSVFEWSPFFGPKWEKNQIEKRLGRKL